MKKYAHCLLAALALPALLLTLNLQFSTARAQGTAFTYQGQLQDNGVPANGTYDLKFELLPTGSGLASAIATVTNSAVGVTNGLFTVTLDFGANFPGADRWLDIFVRTNGAAAFTGLTPRQQLTPAPYAITAATAITADSANNLTGLIVQQNADDAPNVIGGSSVNYVSGGVEGATIGGGGAVNSSGYAYTNSVTGDFGTVSGGAENTASDYEATVGGGGFNTADGEYATVGGGYANSVKNTQDFGSTVGGGELNTTSGDHATVGGGDENSVTEDCGTVGGGIGNTANFDATVGGGSSNIASYDFTTIGGGLRNQATNYSATVPGGYENIAGGQYSLAAGQQAQAINDGTFVWADSQNGPFASTANDQFLIRAAGGVGINTANPQQSLSVNGGMNIDQGNFDNGTLNTNGLIFGGGSGEGIGSARTGAGADVNGLNFYTAFSKRITILNDGNVGIGTNQPGTVLDVQGNGTATGGVSGYNEVIARFKNTRAGSHSAIAIDALANQSSILYFTEDGVPKWDLRHDRNQDNLEAFWHNGATFTTPLILTTNGNLTVSGTVTANGVLLTSDRNAKEHFASVNPQTVLAKVAALPMSEWNYKTDAAAQKHIGPMAQDFHAAFGLDGSDDKHISVIDEGGVALAAIQGLNQKLQEELKQQNTENAELKQQNDSLAQRLNALEQTVQSLAERK